MADRRTVLYDKHLSLGGKMAPFAGYLMPIQYQGIIAEHMATRTAATVFDTCHMGEFRIRGDKALADLENLLSCRVGTMETGQCRYGFICNATGGVVDDQITYRLGEDEFFMVVNAATQETDFEWLRSRVSQTTQIENLSSTTAKIDLQGPASAKIMQRLMQDPIGDMKFYRFKHNRYKGEQVLTSRTGYTGEMGFEIYCDNDLAGHFWDDCLRLGAQPAGLGARDTLRLEMCFPLYGHELSADRNAAESGFEQAIATDKQFIGSQVVLEASARTSRLVAMVLDGRRAARAGDALLDPNGAQLGVVTSGSYSPCLGNAIAMGYVSTPYSAPGTEMSIRTQRHALKARICEPPLYRESTGRKALKRFL